MTGYSPEETALLNSSARMRLAAHGIEVRGDPVTERRAKGDELRHTNGDHCSGCAAHAKRFTGVREGGRWAAHIDQGFRDHNRSIDQEN